VTDFMEELKMCNETVNYDEADMHHELKVQYAWEIISEDSGTNYADTCIFGHDNFRHAIKHQELTARDIAARAVRLYGGLQQG
jgi:hypothetical protein